MVLQLAPLIVPLTNSFVLSLLRYRETAHTLVGLRSPIPSLLSAVSANSAQSRPDIQQRLQSMGIESISCHAHHGITFTLDCLFRRSDPGYARHHDLRFPGRMVDQPDRSMLDSGPAVVVALPFPAGKHAGGRLKSSPCSCHASNLPTSAARLCLVEANMRRSFHSSFHQWHLFRINSKRSVSLTQ
jgi:hypothetical protein